ncbi:MAG: hypothetical protein QXD85_01615, partial [Fervidicoccaceae archaeon]
IAGMQKMGTGSLDERDIDAMIDLAWKVAQKYLQEIERALSDKKPQDERKESIEDTLQRESA